MISDSILASIAAQAQRTAARLLADRPVHSAEDFLARPALMDELLLGRIPFDPSEVYWRLWHTLRREQHMAGLGSIAPNWPLVANLRNAVTATRDDRFPAVWAAHCGEAP